MKLAIVHDLAEAIVGDVSPSQGISDEEKHRQEKVQPSFSSELQLALTSFIF